MTFIKKLGIVIFIDNRFDFKKIVYELNKHTKSTFMKTFENV